MNIVKNEHILNTFYMLGTVSVSRDSEMSKIGKVAIAIELMV